MTETTANVEPRELIKPVAFVAALILAPVAFTAPFAALAMLLDSVSWDNNGLTFLVAIPVAALLFGAVPYLLFGAPAFIIALRKNASTAGAAFGVNAAAFPALWLFFAVTENANGSVAMASFISGFGCLFAPLWGVVFGQLYDRFTRVF